MIGMKIKTLGIFDSGLGGYSVYHHLVTKGPKIEYVLYADQKNAPYGNKNADQIYQYAKKAILWFQDKGIDHILLACNTVSAVALVELKEEFPNMKIWGIIGLTLNQIKDKDIEISVVSTSATFESHAYQNTWNKPENVYELALSDLVGMIEGEAKEDEMDAYLKKKLKDLKGHDALILACTHFPLVNNLFVKYFEGEILDSQKPILKLVESIAGTSTEKSKIFTSGDSDVLKKQIKDLFNKDEKVRRI